MFHCIIVAVERRHDHHHDDHDHVCLSLHASFSDVLIPKMRRLATAKIFQRRRRMEGLWEVPTSLKLIASESDMNRRCSVRMCKLAATRNARNKFRDQYCTAFVYFKWHSHKFAPNYRTNYHSANQLSHPLWPELAQLHYFGKILTVYLQFLRVNLVFGKLRLYFGNFYAIGRIFIVANGPILKNSCVTQVTLLTSKCYRNLWQKIAVPETEKTFGGKSRMIAQQQ